MKVLFNHFIELSTKNNQNYLSVHFQSRPNSNMYRCAKKHGVKIHTHKIDSNWFEVDFVVK